MTRPVRTILTTAALVAASTLTAQATPPHPPSVPPAEPPSSASVICSDVEKDDGRTRAVRCRVAYSQEWWGGVFVVPEIDWAPDGCAVLDDPWLATEYQDDVTDPRVTVVDPGSPTPGCRAVVRWDAVPVRGPDRGRPVGFELVVTTHGPEVHAVAL